MTETETLRPLEILGRVAKSHGWALCLSSSRDGRQKGKRIRSDRLGAKLTSLVVMEPGDVAPRTEAIFKGELISKMPLETAAHGDVPLDEAASCILHALDRNGLLDGCEPG